MANIKFLSKIALFNQQVRFYPRWSHRKPARVFAPEGHVEQEAEKASKPQPQKRQEPTIFDKYGAKKINWDKSKAVDFKVKPKRTHQPLTLNQKNKKPTTDMFETVIDNEGNFVFTKMDNNDHRVGTILTEVKSRKEQDKKNLILLEGKRLIKDALQAGCQLKYILFSRKTDLDFFKESLPKTGAHLYKMPYREMQMWSDLTTNPGVMGIFKTPDISSYISKESLPITVICDNIREPGNLGAILRVCAGLGCSKLLLTKGCANLWDSKVLRSAVGAHFRLQIHKNTETEQIEDELKADASIFIADNRVVSQAASDDPAEVEAFLKNLPIFPYYSVQFNDSRPIVLVVGGETHGISSTTYAIASQNNGMRLNIPLSNDVESLNVGAALGIIAFEMKRQLLEIK